MQGAVLLIGFFIVVGVSFIVGMFISRGQKGNQNYYLANRSLGGWALGFSVMATQLGGGLVLGTADAAYESGWSIYLWPLGNALGLFIIALGLGQKLRKLGIGTVAELFEKVYEWPFLRKWASYLSISSLFLILMAQIIASKRLLLSLGIDSTLLFVFMWLLVILYTVMGGIKTVVYTDIIQAIVILSLLGIGATVIFSLPSMEATAVPIFQKAEGGFSTWFLMPFLFMVIGQDMGQRCFSAKDDKAVRKAFTIGALGIAVTGLMPIGVGLYAKYAGLTFPAGTSVLMGTFQLIGSPMVAGLIGCAVLVALISTVDSLLCAISSNIALDFSLKNLSGKSAQWITFIVGSSAIAISLFFQNISQFLMVSYELSCVCLAVPVLLGLFLRRGRAMGALLSMILGASAFIFFKIVPIAGKEIFSLMFSLLGYALGYLVSINKEKIIKVE